MDEKRNHELSVRQAGEGTPETDEGTGLESCAKSVYYPVRRPDAAVVMKFRLHKIRDTLFRCLLSGINNASFGHSFAMWEVQCIQAACA